MLVNLADLLYAAKAGKYGIGAFNTPNLETVQCVIEAAEELNLPVIIQHAECHENLITMEDIAPVMLEFAKKSTVPVCVHFDHGESFESCMKAIRLGFTSVMIDQSTTSFENNLAITKEVCKAAHAAGVSVEAELGNMFTSSVGGGEGRGAVGASDFASLDDAYTDPMMALKFVEETGVDALAIAFGTSHGVYLTTPVLDLDRILKIRQAIDIPFVMHGGSGVSDEAFKQAIRNGITKINYYTYGAMAGGEAVAFYVEQCKENGDPVFYHDVIAIAKREIKENIKAAMKVFAYSIL